MTRFEATASRIALTLAVAVTASGCEEFLDVNEDPNNPQSVAMELTLPGMLIAFGHEVLGPGAQRYDNLVGPTGWSGEWLGQWAWNNDEHTYAQFQWYEVANLDTDAYWSSGYADVMREAVNIMATTEETGQMGFHGIAKFMYAWNASLLTDAFGPIPLTEAFNTGNPNPKYDSQQEVYAQVFTMIDEAIAEMQQPSERPPGYTDIMYKGDMAKWVRLANTVKARLHMRLAYAPGESATEHAQAALAALAAGLTGPADAPTLFYEGGNDYEQPFYRFGNEGYGEPSRAAEYTVELLRRTNDPRMPIMIRPADLVCPAGIGYQRADCTIATETVYRGHPSGVPGEPDSAISRIGNFFAADSSDHVWLSYDEAKMIEAEAVLITSGAAAADAPYRAAIRANMVRLGVPTAQIDAYLDDLPTLGAEGNALEELITQKYIINFLRDEVWHDWRRTGYPVIEPVAERVIEGIPVRLRTPAAEMQFNGDMLAATGIPTGLDGMLVDVWWASGTAPGGR
jgi:Starch-binding associating with outer membrane